MSIIAIELPDAVHSSLPFFVNTILFAGFVPFARLMTCVEQSALINELQTILKYEHGRNLWGYQGESVMCQETFHWGGGV